MKLWLFFNIIFITSLTLLAEVYDFSKIKYQKNPTTSKTTTKKNVKKIVTVEKEEILKKTTETSKKQKRTVADVEALPLTPVNEQKNINPEPLKIEETFNTNFITKLYQYNLSTQSVLSGFQYKSQMTLIELNLQHYFQEQLQAEVIYANTLFAKESTTHEQLTFAKLSGGLKWSPMMNSQEFKPYFDLDYVTEDLYFLNKESQNIGFKASRGRLAMGLEYVRGKLRLITHLFQDYYFNFSEQSQQSSQSLGSFQKSSSHGYYLATQLWQSGEKSLEFFLESRTLRHKMKNAYSESIAPQNETLQQQDQLLGMSFVFHLFSSP